MAFAKDLTARSITLMSTTISLHALANYGRILDIEKISKISYRFPSQKLEGLSIEKNSSLCILVIFITNWPSSHSTSVSEPLLISCHRKV
jgi:hypothetical protein